MIEITLSCQLKAEGIELRPAPNPLATSHPVIAVTGSSIEELEARIGVISDAVDTLTLEIVKVRR